jgi:hypothetical protein
MNYFTFRYDGLHYNFSSSDRRTAMVEANKYFCTSHGIWMEKEKNQFEWVFGNFFD